MEGVTQKFSAAKEHKDMIVHEQLTAMERWEVQLIMDHWQFVLSIQFPW